MKKILFVLVMVLCCGIFTSCNNKNEKAFCAMLDAKAEQDKHIQDSINRVEFINDSIRLEEQKQDSIKLAMEREETIAKLKNKFSTKKDDFKDVIWYEPKTAPKYTNRNGVYCYFYVKDGVADNLRFRFQYYAEDWLFIKYMTFNIDGNNYTIYPYMETDCGDGGKIWEWCDVKVGYGDVDAKFIKALANAKQVKVKMYGRQYYDVRTLTQTQIASIKDSYNYYTALGGQI